MKKITESEFDDLWDDGSRCSMYFKGTDLYGFDLDSFKNGSTQY